MTDLLIAGLKQPVRFFRCPMLLGQVRRFFHSWPHEEVAPSPGGAVIHVRAFGREEKGYDIRAPWLPEPLHEPTMASALCSLAIELVAAFGEEHPDVTCLHAAAVQIGGNTVLLLGDNRAGKSTLVARLMAQGQLSLGDDLIGVTPQGELLSFGIPPRLRLPLPPSAALAAFARTYKGIRDDRYQYLQAACGLCAPFGQRALPTHIVILQRRGTESARFLPLEHRSGLMQLLPHYVMRRGSAETVLSQASQLIREIPALMFRYSNLDEACDALLHRLEAAPSAPAAPLPPAGFPLPSPAEQQRGPLSRACFIQAPGTRLRVKHGNTFLLDGASDRVYGLNSLGKALWNLLEEPLSEAEAAFLLQEAFPHAEKQQIAHDVAELFSLLKAEGLIVEPKPQPSLPPREQALL